MTDRMTDADLDALTAECAGPVLSLALNVTYAQRLIADMREARAERDALRELVRGLVALWPEIMEDLIADDASAALLRSTVLRAVRQ